MWVIYFKDYTVEKQLLIQSNSFIQFCLQYLIDGLLTQDGRYGNVYCSLSLASPVISLLCLLSWHADLINIGLISSTGC